jgi:DNA-directed RNA polymerase subunit omega
VISLREIADRAIPVDDLREGLIHSIQRNVEVDEPEAVAAPLLANDRRGPILGRDDQASDSVVDVMTEEQLLRGLESMTPSEPSSNGGNGPRERGR